MYGMSVGLVEGSADTFGGVFGTTCDIVEELAVEAAGLIGDQVPQRSSSEESEGGGAIAEDAAGADMSLEALSLVV